MPLPTRRYFPLSLVFLLAVYFSFSLPRASAASTASSTENVFTLDNPVLLSVGPGLAVMSGKAGWAFNAGASTRVLQDLPVFVGVDLAFNRWDPSSYASLSSFQALPTAYYVFDFPQIPSWAKPYAGLSVGPNLLLSHYTGKVGGVPYAQSDTRLALEALLRVGAQFEMNRKVAFLVEPKLGVLDGNFIFLPQVNLLVSL